VAITTDTNTPGIEISLDSAHRVKVGLLCLWTMESMSPQPPAASNVSSIFYAHDILRFDLHQMASRLSRRTLQSRRRSLMIRFLQ